MGINIGAFASPLVCGWLAQHSAFKTLLQNNGFDPVNSWHWGFGAAAVGMTLGVLQYLFGSSKAGVVFRWLTVVLLTGFLLLMLFVSGGTKVEVSGEMAQYSTTALVVGGIVAAAVIVLHLLWLLGYVLSGAGSRRFLLWGAVGSLVALVLVSGIIYSGSEYSDPAMVDESAIVTEPSVASDAVDTGTVGQESAANEVAAEEEAPPRNTTLLIVLILSALIVLGHSIWLFTRGNKVYAAIGVLVVLGLWAAKLDFIAADTGPVLLLVRIVSYLLPVFSYVYFAWIFQDRTWTPVERKRIYAIPVFFLGAAVFWSAFEQAGSTLTLFADRFTHNVLFSFPYPSSWFQSINALFIVLLAPVFAWAWVRLAKANREPSSPMKFAVGLYLLGVGFAVLAFGAVLSGSGGGLVGPQWLLSVYLLHTLGELCLSPVGLSTMTKLAPDRISGQMMGVWFLGAAIGNFIGGIVAGFFESFPLPLLFLAIFGFTLLATIVMLIIVKPIRALMSGVN
jgi:dipeptide/tripeptide permease